jgi:hypothetical protein
MNENKPASRQLLKSDLARVNAHKARPEEYEELPDLTEDMLSRAKMMVDHNVALTRTGIYELKKIDADYFEGE